MEPINGRVRSQTLSFSALLRVSFPQCRPPPHPKAQSSNTWTYLQGRGQHLVLQPSTGYSHQLRKGFGEAELKIRKPTLSIKESNNNKSQNSTEFLKSKWAYHSICPTIKTVEALDCCFMHPRSLHISTHFLISGWKQRWQWLSFTDLHNITKGCPGCINGKFFSELCLPITL